MDHTVLPANNTMPAWGVVMTSLKFSRWRPLTSPVNFRFQFDSAAVLRRSRSLSVPNFVNITQSMAELNYFRFGKTNGRHFEILLPVSALTYRSPPASHFASANQISCESDHRRQSYDVINFFSRWRPLTLESTSSSSLIVRISSESQNL